MGHTIFWSHDDSYGHTQCVTWVTWAGHHGHLYKRKMTVRRGTLDLWQWTYFVYFYLCFDWRKFLNFLDWNKEQSATLEHDQNKNVLFRFKDLRGLEGNDRIVTNSRNNPKYRWKRWCLIEIPSRARVGFMPRRALSSENLERYFNQSRKVFYVLDYI